jgi:hypothetical protein
MIIKNLLKFSLISFIAMSITGCNENDTTTNGYIVPQASILNGTITEDTLLTNDKIWTIAGSLVVTDNANLKIEPGTVILGRHGGGSETSYLVIDKNSNIYAEGTPSQPILFTSDVAYYNNSADYGEWGGVILIGNAGNPQVNPFEAKEGLFATSTNMADSSGVLKYVTIDHSGSNYGSEDGQEINGLSLIGVGSETIIEDITISESKDDCLEIWGGTVNFKNLNISNCYDDGFDFDKGYTGTVNGMNITVGVNNNSAIEMSGGLSTVTFNDVNILMNEGNKDSALYFKNGGSGSEYTEIAEGAHFNNLNITMNVPNTYQYGAIYVRNTANLENISFDNTTINGSYDGVNGYFINETDSNVDDADEIENIFLNGNNNTITSSN